ncbi:L-histidine N(alpha)-methyltransferase [Flammeovirga pacifica]|uniref:Dimethylhistidine N-methyltransferase n=1 Tax=Flammeovirga pacifica TaxID=915059 RepID=A0A1S1Z2P2_FLAPC|nr:L-histidine N(alpha)-methyltransferase [Flammeovirga pacifica]OHX67548.1 dimethylhistidine N-methyltransferase [Flammeovirga pacifica]
MITEKTLFAQHVEKGLSASSKFLSSMYFYDKKGEGLFRQIMNLDEYYLTNCELEILMFQGHEIAHLLSDEHLEIIELGAGDGIKTKELLRHFPKDSTVYRPIDISEQAIIDISKKMSDWIPNLKVEGICGDYFKMLDNLKSNNKKVILFLGSNLGNMNDEQAKGFIQQLNLVMQKGDQLLLGLDLIKPKNIVLPAYNDSKGITSEFNLNLLDRINKELGGDFDRTQFEHVAIYNENEGIAKSYIKSKIDQTVSILENDTSFHFKKGELIHTEISRKYDLDIIRNIIDNTSLHLDHQFTDHKQYFTNLILTKH